MEIVTENVKKVYRIKNGLFKSKKIDVVKNLNYSVKQGEIIALMGMASSGKSTIINLLSGKERPTSGRIFVDGEVNRSKLRNFCEVISDFRTRKMLGNESVYNNLVYYGIKMKVASLDVEKKIVDLRDVLSLEKMINKRVCDLNELELVKLHVCISMLKNPAILYFDNAFIGLNPVIKSSLLKILKRINKEFKTTIVIASVDLMDIEKICKRISVVQEGKIIVDGEYESVKNKYWRDKNVSVTFNKTYTTPKGDFEIIETNDYFLKVKIDFSKCDFATFINQFDINSIVDINISSVPLVNL